MYNNSEPVSTTQPDQPAATLAITNAKSCRECIYFSGNHELLRCAVNPMAAQRYQPWQPNDCPDFQMRPQSEEARELEVLLAERERCNEVALQAATEDAFRSIQSDLLGAIERTDVDGLFYAVNRLDEALEALQQQRFHQIVGCADNSDGPPVPDSMLRYRLPATLSQARDMLLQQRRELGDYVMQSAADSERIELLTSSTAQLNDHINELYERQRRIDEGYNSWSPTQAGVVLFIAIFLYGAFILLAGPKNVAGYSFGFVAGGLTVFLVRG